MYTPELNIKISCWCTKVYIQFRPKYLGIEHSECFACHLLTRWYLACLIPTPWGWKWYFLPKRLLTFNGLHGVISQKLVLFVNTAVRTSNPNRNGAMPPRQPAFLPTGDWSIRYLWRGSNYAVFSSPLLLPPPYFHHQCLVLRHRKPILSPTINGRKNYRFAYFNFCNFRQWMGRQTILNWKVASIRRIPSAFNLFANVNFDLILSLQNI
jgi:hypothetical protein